MPNRDKRFADALVWANQMHADQRRNGTDIPYYSHLMAVTSLVMENGGDADECIAALLHDVLEDCKYVSRDDVAVRFGDRVADIVVGLSDADLKPDEDKGPWHERKERYLDHLRTTQDEGILRVSNADKLHNATSILRDLRDPAIGESVFKRFSAEKADTLWYYQTLSEIFRERSPAPRLAAELSDVVDSISA